MRIIYSSLICAVFTLQSCLATSAEQHQQVVGHVTNKVTFRPAVYGDLDDITTVLCDAFSPGPLWRYVFPRYAEFKEYHWKCFRKEIGRRGDGPQHVTFNNVISVTDGENEKVVSIASWVILDPNSESSSRELDGVRYSDLISMHKKCSDNLDTNLTRVIDYDKQFTPAMDHYVGSFPKRQMYLGLLATHPDWDGHGFGAMQCQWGMDKMKATGVPVTLVATEAGWPLYDQLGFKSLANITIKTLDWPEDIWYEYMRYETGSE